jgi:hypothetical protein
VSTPPMPTPERLGPEGTAGPRPDRARAGPFPPGPLSANRLGLRTRDRGGSSSVNTGGRSSARESPSPERWEKKPDS